MTHFERVHVIGARGRVGSALSARLAQRGVALTEDRPDLVLLCVPDRAIAEVARELEPGPWVAHVSGATPLAALEPALRRFGLHPLQTFTKRLGPEQLDGAYRSVTGESEEALAAGRELADGARAEGLRARRCAAGRLPRRCCDRVELPRHAAARRRLAARGRGSAAEALDPLMRRVIENDFELTGPIERGDWETVERHLEGDPARAA